MTTPHRQYRYYDFVMAAFVTVLICSNLIGPAKIAQIDAALSGRGHLRRRRAVLPDLLRVRRHPHRGLRLRALAQGDLGRLRRPRPSPRSWRAVVVALPPAPFWNNQPAYEIAFGSTWRIVLASLVRLFLRRVRQLLRAGEDEDPDRAEAGCGPAPSARPFSAKAVDSLLFYPLAFYGSGIIPNDKLPLVMLSQFVIKVGRRSRVHPGHLQGGQRAQARRARGLLRPPYRLQSVHAQDLRPSRVVSDREIPNCRIRGARGIVKIVTVCPGTSRPPCIMRDKLPIALGKGAELVRIGSLQNPGGRRQAWTYRGNDYDVSAQFNTTDPQVVNDEVDRIYLDLYPAAPTRAARPCISRPDAALSAANIRAITPAIPPITTSSTCST